ncbi:hypothetical protein GQ457_06G032680 [Hibiscus cannabinus]
MVPKLQQYGCMVDILGRAGQIDEERKFSEETPIEANVVIWSLLSACKKHDNNGVTEPTAKQSHWTQVKTSTQYNIYI